MTNELIAFMSCKCANIALPQLLKNSDSKTDGTTKNGTFSKTQQLN